MRSARLLLWLVVGGLALIVVVASIVACEGGEVGAPANDRADSDLIPSARDRFKLAKIFDFRMYKRLFHKTYGYLEEIVRGKYFMARAFRAWTSSIKYKFRKSSFYLALNHLSDRSPEELKLRLNQHAGLDPQELKNVVVVGIEQANRKTIISKGQASDILTMERRKRDLLQVDERAPRELDEEKLISTGDGVKMDPTTAGKVDDHPESNNAHLYEAPEETDTNATDPRESEMGQLNIKCLSNYDNRERDPNWMEINETSFFSARDDPSKPDEMFFDHRESNCMFLPRDQGSCGSCYAFTAITIAEWLHCKQTGKLVAFSEQYLVDCGTIVGADGCDGGDYYKMAKFIQTFGLELQANYPYRFRQDQCPYDSSVSAKSMGYIRMKLNTIMWVPLRRLEEFIPYGPMFIGISRIDGFQEYGGGVIDGSDCKPEGTHGVVLIGHGREDGREYWLMRNSYSVGWGEGGYFKLAKESDCIHHRLGVLFGTENGIELIHQVEDNTHNDPQTIKSHYINILNANHPEQL